MSDLSPKFLKALLNGIVKMTIYKNPDITPALIQKQIFSGSKLERGAIKSFVGECTSMLKRCASQNMSLSMVAKMLGKSSLSGEHKKVFHSFWKAERETIHNFLVKQCVWTNSTLEHVSWRVDVKAQSREHEELNDTSAILQLKTKDSDSKADCLQLELNRDSLSTMLATFDDIAECIRAKTKI